MRAKCGNRDASIDCQPIQVADERICHPAQKPALLHRCHKGICQRLKRGRHLHSNAVCHPRERNAHLADRKARFAQ